MVSGNLGEPLFCLRAWGGETAPTNEKSGLEQLEIQTIISIICWLLVTSRLRVNVVFLSTLLGWLCSSHPADLIMALSIQRLLVSHKWHKSWSWLLPRIPVVNEGCLGIDTKIVVILVTGWGIFPRSLPPLCLEGNFYFQGMASKATITRCSHD